MSEEWITMKLLPKSFILACFVIVMLGSLPVFQAKAGTGGDQAESEKDIVVENGMTQEVFSHEDAVTETVEVETNFDNDGDGINEKISVKVIRPAETEEGLEVPVIYNMSSYNGGLDYPDYHNVDKELYEGIPYNLPNYYEDYFVSRGYAVVIADGLGAAGSTGCPKVGDEQEINAAKSVVNWLNDKTTAYNEGGNEVKADWTTGKVGMVGKSYDGSLANGLAATGVEGLETIVPIGAISNWYDYYRANGAVIAPGGYQGDGLDLLAKGVLTRENPEVCAELMDQLEKDQDRETGDYSEFWDERNYLNDADRISASVFLVHGLNDINVKPKQYAQWWEELKQHDVPRKLWLHQGAHTDPKEEQGEEWLTTLNKWFDYWLYDIDSGIMDEPRVEIGNVAGSREPLEEWPRVDAVDQKLYLSNSSKESVGLSHTEKTVENTTESFTDDATKTAEELIKDPSSEFPNRLAYLSPVLTENIRLSGTPSLSINASIDHSAANLSAWLVDYGPNGAEIVTRGWMDAQNVDSISESKDLVPNQKYTFNWEMEPHDYEFSSGHKIGLVIVSSDNEYTKRPEPGTKIKVYPAESHITLPLVGKFPEDDGNKVEES